MSNTTFTPPYTLYPVPQLIPGVSDLHLSLAAPIVVHWLTSFMFHCFETGNYFQRYRLHTSAEELTRNTVSRAECFRGVVVNQVIQTLLGISLGFLGEGDFAGREDYDVAIWATRVQAMQKVLLILITFTGIDANGLAQKLDSLGWGFFAGGNSVKKSPQVFLAGYGTATQPFTDWQIAIAKLIYWYIVPAIQFAVAIFVADTWQYFGHRFEHTNKWVYKHVHSIHHSLYVPYSYGAAYTHILEGLFLDSVGTAIAFGFSGLTIRQGLCLYSYISFKAVTDHGGYAFPWNPILLFSKNDSAFHDLHHQRWGTKYNYAVHTGFWDRLMGTYWANLDSAAALYERNRILAQQVVDSKSKIAILEPSLPLGTTSELLASKAE